MSHKSILSDPPSILVGVAEECFETARLCLKDVLSSSGDAAPQYQKIMATGLSCLEATLQTGRLTPRQEAKVRLKYAAILYEETDNIMEAETALSAGISLCDKHRYWDLKYSMAYLQAKLLFQRGHAKGAVRALDSQLDRLP